MSTDNVASWRDLADQLTDEQVAEIEYMERENIPPRVTAEQGHLNYARMAAAHNLVQALHAGIPTPADLGKIRARSEFGFADATEVDDWTEWDRLENQTIYARPYTASARDVGPVTVELAGVQYADGQVRRYILTRPNSFGNDGEMTAAQARALAAALLDAADEIERMDANR